MYGWTGSFLIVFVGDTGAADAVVVKMTALSQSTGGLDAAF